jgi:hypothetical protein
MFLKKIYHHVHWRVKFLHILPDNRWNSAFSFSYISLAQRSTKLSLEQYVPTRLTTPTDMQGHFRGQLYTRNSMNGNLDENLLVSHVSFRFVYAAFRVSACTVRLHVRVSMRFTSVAHIVQAIPVSLLKCVFKNLVESQMLISHRFTCCKYTYAPGPWKICTKPYLGAQLTV